MLAIINIMYRFVSFTFLNNMMSCSISFIMVYPSWLEVSTCIYEALGECHCCWTIGPKGHMYPSYSVNFSLFVVFESINIYRFKIDSYCNMVGLLHHPIWFHTISEFFRLYFMVLLYKYLTWPRITYGGYIPETSIWCILLIS